MKKSMIGFILLISALPFASACGQTDYSAYVSDVRSDVFLAETETFSLRLSCLSRERPYTLDGIPSPKSNLVEIVLTPASPTSEDVSVIVEGEKEYGGEMTYRAVSDDYYYSQGVESFPSRSVTLRVTYGGEEVSLTATSVKNENTISPEQALDYAVKSEKETVKRLADKNGFQGEFQVRLLRREQNYYFVGITDKTGKTVCLLLNAETGEVLARHERETHGH